MAKLSALVVLVALAPSCGGTSTVLFTGHDVEGPGGFGVAALKSKDRVLAMNTKLGFILPLPYAEDWTFEPTAQKPVSGRSSTLRMFATLQVHQPEKRVDEESYLRDEYLKNLRSHWEADKVPYRDVAIARRGEHFVLEYVTEGTLPDGKPFHQTHFWTFRQREDRTIFEVHLSTIWQSDPVLGEICARMRTILGSDREFMLVPPADR